MTFLRYLGGNSLPARRISDWDDFREIYSDEVKAELESQNSTLRNEIRKKDIEIATAEEIKKQDDRVRADLEGKMAQINRRIVLAEEKTRRQTESHEEERSRQEAMIKALLEEKRLQSNELKNKVEYTMDDRACETLMREIFHLLNTWCFSNFKIGTGCRTEILSEIGQMLASGILAPLVLGLHPQESQMLDKINFQILTSVPKYDEHRWRLIKHACYTHEESRHIESWHAFIENKFAGIADQGKAENRGRFLRRILEKAVSLQKKLHVQESNYIVEWISGGTSFSAEYMQIQGIQVPESRPRVVQYCLEPLILKAVCREEYHGTVVIVPAILCQTFHVKMAVKIIENDNGLEGLKSKKSTQRLNQIDRIREFGVGDHISLPQLAVCGDQSAGKSSALERITGIPFPREDGVCTKFPTEIILRHSTETSRITATIIPTSARSEPDKVLLRAYHKELDDFTELPDVILEAATLMRIRGYGVNEGPAFAADVLRIEVVGDTGLHLTVVDLPGLIAVENDEQTEEDIALVDTLVDAYLKSSRTIILAVVQANNDIANQSVIRRARKFDRDGQRTVGIITKPDLINKGTEGRIASLAKNESPIKLKLGFYLLKNPSPSQLESGMSRSEQIHQELDFFASASWKEHRLDPSRIGIISLQHFLQDLHSRHIEKELPMVRGDYGPSYKDRWQSDKFLRGFQRRMGKTGMNKTPKKHQECILTNAKVYLRTRGRELPGNYNHVLLSELYHEQSSRWTLTASAHLTSVLAATASFVDMVLNCIVVEEDVKSRIREIIQSKFEIQKLAAAKELEMLIKDEKRQPITYNHYYTDNIQNARHDAIKGNIQNAMQSVEHDQNGKLHACKTAMDSMKLIASLQNRVIVNMDDQACSEALAGLNAYYKVCCYPTLWNY
ncbi:hypothetical protein ACLOAV_005848 [Pseudogymnoascus australis]